jgi:hypothetical protein
MSPLVCGEEYRIGATVVRSQPADASFRGYEDLYSHADTLVRARAARLTCSNECPSLHIRMVGHTWFRHAATNLVRAAITLGVTCLKNGEVGTAGKSRPTSEALAVAGGMTPEQLAQLGVKKGFDEIYSDADVRAEPDSNGMFTFSYGEYVKSVERIDYKTLVRRAEEFTAFHLQLLGKSEPSSDLNIVKREWFYATNPDIAVVHIYVRV